MQRYIATWIHTSMNPPNIHSAKGRRCALLSGLFRRWSQIQDQTKRYIYIYIWPAATNSKRGTETDLDTACMSNSKFKTHQIKFSIYNIEGLLQKGNVQQPSYITSHSRGWASVDSSMLGSCACHKFRTDWMEALKFTWLLGRVGP